MPRKRQGHLLRRDAAAVIAHPDQLATALGHVDVDAPRPGIQGVLHQLLDDRRGPLHHFASGNLRGDFGR